MKLKFFQTIRNQTGIALLVILSVTAIVLPLIQGVWMDSQIHYQFQRYRMNQLQAKYNAKAGMDISLLRIYIFKGIENAVPSKLDILVRPVLDTIWSFPFIWPLHTESEEFLKSEERELHSLSQLAFLKGGYFTSIEPEDGRLDVNDLSSPISSLREFTYETLYTYLLLSIEENEKLRNKYKIQDIVRILNNLKDWTDLDNNSLNGGSEDLIKEGTKPLNRSFISVDEIQKVPDLSQDIYELLKPVVTVYGVKALNMNYVSEKTLRALNIPEEVLELVLSRIQFGSENYAPFLNQQDFCEFMEELAWPLCTFLKERYESLDMLSFDYPMVFRIQTNGEYRSQLSSLELVIYDLSSVALNYQRIRHYELERQKQREQGLQPNLDPEEFDSEKKQENKEKQKKIDYSYYKSLIIMYVKEIF